MLKERVNSGKHILAEQPLIKLVRCTQCLRLQGHRIRERLGLKILKLFKNKVAQTLKIDEQSIVSDYTSEYKVVARCV